MRASRALHRPWLYAPQTPEDFREYLVRALRPSTEFFLACRREDDAIVGFLNLSEIVRGSFQSAYLGYGAVAAFAGQGYMTRGARARCSREAFARSACTAWRRTSSPGNAASISLVRRGGFRLEGLSPRYLKIGGRWRDHERWAILSEDWRAGGLTLPDERFASELGAPCGWLRSARACPSPSDLRSGARAPARTAAGCCGPRAPGRARRPAGRAELAATHAFGEECQGPLLPRRRLRLLDVGTCGLELCLASPCCAS